MYVEFFLKPLICFSPADDAGAGGEAAAGAAGADTTPGSAGSDTLEGGTGADTVTDGQGADTITAGSAKWWEDAKFNDHRDLLVSKGLTLDDKDEVIARLAKGEKAAQMKLGKPADQLLTKPGKGESVAEWLKSNGTTFGIPESPDKYDVQRPDSWPKDAPWNDALESKVREIGLAKGMSNDAVNAMVGLYAENIMALDQQATADFERGSAEMMAALEKDWGDQTQAKLTLASQAASVIAEKAGLDASGMENLAAALKPKIGDAGTMRVFAAIGEMMGDDQMVLGEGGTSLNTTPAEARAQLDQLQGKGGEYYEATQKRDQQAMKRLQPKIDRLTKIAAG